MIIDGQLVITLFNKQVNDSNFESSAFKVTFFYAQFKVDSGMSLDCPQMADTGILTSADNFRYCGVSE
ncbi:hypothetical protein EFP47_05100 [Lactiplantibacillus pentosus]|nr:hypothetical protein [Lactiplantibacillus pentosus]